MSELKIKITAVKETAPLDQTTEQLKKLETQGAKTSGSFTKFLDGIKKLGREIPIVGLAVDTLKNPFVALSAVIAFGVARFREYSAELTSMVSTMDRSKKPLADAGQAFETAAEGAAKLAAALKDIQTYSDAVIKGLGTQIEKLDEQFAATEKLLEAEAELAKARVDRDVADPVARARAKASIDDTLAARKLGLAGKKGQQAALIDKQIQRERELQIDVQSDVPRREDVVAAVSTYESDKQRYNEAFAQNRAAFGKAELLRRFNRDSQSPEFFKIFAPSEVRELQKMGLISGVREIGSSGVFANDPLDTAAGGKMRTNVDLARQMLPGAEAAQAAARETLARARSSLGASRGVLPAGVRSMADVDPFIDSANAAAAGVQNESYRRAEGLMLKRDQLLRGQSLDIQLQKISTQKTAITGQMEVRAAEAAADKTADKFEAFTNRLDRRIDTLERAVRAQSQN